MSTADLEDGGLYALREEELRLHGDLSPFATFLNFSLVFENTRAKEYNTVSAVVRPRPFIYLPFRITRTRVSIRFLPFNVVE